MRAMLVWLLPSMVTASVRMRHEDKMDKELGESVRIGAGVSRAGMERRGSGSGSDKGSRESGASEMRWGGGEEEELGGQEAEREGSSAGESYHPVRGLRRQTMFWSYNCQMMNSTRAIEWSDELKGTFVCMQGTQATFDIAKGERSLQLWRTEHHDIWESKQPKRKGAGCQPEGVAIFAPRGMSKCSRAVYTPSTKELQSRAMAVHFQDGLYDVTVVSIYCPVCNRDPANAKLTELSLIHI